MPAIQPKPSFLSSVTSGVTGWFKGLLSGGAIGAVGGAVLMAGIAVVSALVAGNPITWGLAAGGIGAAALGGAAQGAAIVGSLGGLAGVVTGVIRSREAAQPSSGELVNALNTAHQHGELVGQQQVVQQLMAAQEQQSHKWRSKIGKEQQAANAIAQASHT